MSKLLYQTDSYMREFKSKVVKVMPDENGVVLEESAFYPGGGGQPHDKGTIRRINVNILEREEAFKIPDLIRTKINLLPEGITNIRTVEIEGLDLQADGGTHVKNTGEVGSMKITDYKSKGKINKRIYVQVQD